MARICSRKGSQSLCEPAPESGGSGSDPGGALAGFGASDPEGAVAGFGAPAAWMYFEAVS